MTEKKNRTIWLEKSSFGGFDIVVFLSEINLTLKAPCNDFNRFFEYQKNPENAETIFQNEIENIIERYFNSEMNNSKPTPNFFNPKK